MTRQVSFEGDGKPLTGGAGRRTTVLFVASLALVLSTSFSAGQATVGHVVPAEASVDADVAAFYRDHPRVRVWSRGGRPTSAAYRVMTRLGEARAQGLDEDRYLTPLLLRRWKAVEEDRGGAALDALDPLLSSAFVRFARDMKRPPVDLHVVDPGAAAKAESAVLILTRLAKSGDETTITAVLRMSPEYEALFSDLNEWRRLWRNLPQRPLTTGGVVHPGAKDDRIPGLRLRLGSGPGSGSPDLLDEALAARLADFKTWHGLEANGILDDRAIAALNRPSEDYEKAILADLDQLRVLPARQDRRALVVDIAAAELKIQEDGREVRHMRVVVGKPETPTPSMVGSIRYAVLTPYWNLPHDLVRDRIAPEVLRRGPSVLRARGMEALSDWSPQARRLEATEIDWTAVAAGSARLRLRQSPGAGNMMGEAKFIFPNSFGVYLHDTPDKALFDRQGRRFSAGCVRVEDAAWLGRWLMGRDLAAVRTGEPEQKAELASAVPVYLLYLTVKSRRNGGLIFGPDPYGRLAGVSRAKTGRAENSEPAG